MDVVLTQPDKIIHLTGSAFCCFLLIILISAFLETYIAYSILRRVAKAGSCCYRFASCLIPIENRHEQSQHNDRAGDNEEEEDDNLFDVDISLNGDGGDGASVKDGSVNHPSRFLPSCRRVCQKHCTAFGGLYIVAVVSFILTVLLGVAKEAYDVRWGASGVFDRYDLLCDSLGSLCGSAVGTMAMMCYMRCRRARAHTPRYVTV